MSDSSSPPPAALADVTATTVNDAAAPPTPHASSSGVGAGSEPTEGALKSLRRGDVVDCQDTRGDWYEAVVCEVKDHKVLIHFAHWTSRWDCWVDRLSTKLAPHGSKIYLEGTTLRKGQRIEAWDKDPTQQKWCEATVVAERPDAVKVHFKGWSERFDEWIPRGSERISPFGTHTRARVPYTPKPVTYWANHTRTAVWGTRRVDAALQSYKDALRRMGMSVRQVDGDGNCLFRSVSHQVYGTEDQHFMIRQRACDYMLIEKEWFNSFVVGNMDEFMDYIAEKRQNRVWGDDPEIQAMCEMFDRPAEIYAYDPSSGARLLRTFHAARSHARPPLRLSYYGGGHYDSITGPGFEAALLSTTPGDAEAAFIAAASDRSLRAVGAVRSGGEDAALAAALRMSREAYDAEAHCLDAALLSSLGLSGDALGLASGVARATAGAGGGGAGAASGSSDAGGRPAVMPGGGTAGSGGPATLPTSTAGVPGDPAAQEAARLAEFQRQRDERELQAALEASRQLASGGGVGGALVAATSGGLDEDEAVRQAMLLSLTTEGGPDADAAAALAAVEEAERAAALAASLATSGGAAAVHGGAAGAGDGSGGRASAAAAADVPGVAAAADVPGVAAGGVGGGVAPRGFLLTEEEQLRLLESGNTDDGLLALMLEKSRQEAEAAAGVREPGVGGVAASGGGSGGRPDEGRAVPPAAARDAPHSSDWPSDQPRR